MAMLYAFMPLWNSEVLIASFLFQRQNALCLELISQSAYCLQACSLSPFTEAPCLRLRPKAAYSQRHILLQLQYYSVCLLLLSTTSRIVHSNLRPDNTFVGSRSQFSNCFALFVPLITTSPPIKTHYYLYQRGKSSDRAKNKGFSL